MSVKQLIACNAVISGWKLFALWDFIYKLYVSFLWYKFLLLFCSQEKLRSIVSYLNLVPPSNKTVVEDWFRFDRDFLLELLVWSLLQAADMCSPIVVSVTYPWLYVCLPLIMLLCSISPWFGWNLVLNIFTNPYKILCGCQNATVYDTILC